MSQIPGAAAAAAAAQAWLVEKGELIALFGESIFYGAHVITCGLCLRELLLSRDMKWKFPGSIHWTMLSGALFLIFLSTFHLALGLRYNLNAIKVYLGIPGANLAFFDLAYWETIMQSVIYVTETILADALLIYRAHIVWDKSWRIVVLPLLLWFATTAIGCTTLWMVASTQHVVPSEAQRRLEHWMDGFLSITFTVNILCTSLIVHKIWRVNTQVASSALHPARLTHIVRVVIDSGLIYTACIIALFGSTLANSATQFLFSSVLVQVIGIAFNLIIIREAFHYTWPAQPEGTVVVVGLGIAGVKAFNYLRGALPSGWHLVGIERNEYAFFPIPALRATVEAGYEKHCFAELDHLPVVGSSSGKCEASILPKTAVVQLNTQSVILERSKPQSEATTEVAFDYCIIATGASYQYPCRTSDPSLRASLSQFAQFQDALSKSSSVLVIGGGLAGIEFAGDVASHFQDKRVVLIVSRTPETMFEEGVPVSLAKKTLESLRTIGVEVRLSERVVGARDMVTGPCKKCSVPLQSGQSIEGIDFIFVAIGNQANSSLMQDLAPGSISATNGLVHVTPTLQLSHTPSPEKSVLPLSDSSDVSSRIFVVGDVSDEQKSARSAFRQGLYAAQSIVNLVYGRPVKPYNPASAPVYLFSIGSHYGGGAIGRWVWNSRIASMLYEYGLPAWCKGFRQEYNSPLVQV
ncbi:hypothetical protein GLOTRDRAFT_130568 [Gloeophyllum trabeum ATCC 11539]|uniref:FAD/NAD(P)-binding domain-containing protein n=1 Tax=Gloeophyllum trabeum (strain ATCC 11539 / FP-39264 / Madison 617) TaxID=670483 RepID=S7RNN0_GLOTA|nr:uncharacterized protein GLOTRDRAFT_130568 [Gloeophyllum trabeum ATCC 11539]EPQ54379.1 hypothetical protein GLOTRDRAFT_130568 [Gloeophyllum trabeum ATCC 11539]